MSKAVISIEKIVIPTYPNSDPEVLPIFAENRVHQRSSGRPYPNKVVLNVNRKKKTDKEYTIVRLENDYICAYVLPEIGGRIYAAQDKTTGYDFFYKQNVIKPALIGALGSWISGGVEFNWPYHHRASGFMPCDFTIEETDDSVICWLSEHDPIDRMKGMVGIVLPNDKSYIETRVKLCNRTPVNKSFLWWENAAVPVNSDYQIFFPNDVTYVNFHYLDARISYPIAGDNVFNGLDMTEPRDISWHKNTKDATSYFACASKYDFFGGYDHGKECGVVHIGNHHITPGMKMFTWAYNQLAESWEKALTDTDGQYAELMAGSYSDNQPDFAWLEPYETKEFSQYWYPISRIGAPDYANLNCSIRLAEKDIHIQSTVNCENAKVIVTVKEEVLINETINLAPCAPVKIPWVHPGDHVSITISSADGELIGSYTEKTPDVLKMPEVKQSMPLAVDLHTADELYLAGVHVDQYRDPVVMPDAYWLEGLKRNPKHVSTLVAMAQYSFNMYRLNDAKSYIEKAIGEITKYNQHPINGDVYYVYALILEALGNIEEAYDYYYKASWNGSAVAKSMGRIACIDIKQRNYRDALLHGKQSLSHDINNPLSRVALILTYRALGENGKAETLITDTLASDPLSLLIRYLSTMPKKQFFDELFSSSSQSILDMVFDLDIMGEYELIVLLLQDLLLYRPDEVTAIILFSLAYYQHKCNTDWSDSLANAEQAEIGFTFPLRYEEIKVLQFAIDQGSTKAKLLLGCLLYNKRHYIEASRLFELTIKEDPSNAIAYRNLSVAYYSHLNRKAEALELMYNAMKHSDNEQLIYETIILMSRLSMNATDKLDFINAKRELITRDDIITEYAKAYNQNNQPEEALKLMNNHTFVPCEGGEHAIADQYMYAHYLLGMNHFRKRDFKKALEHFNGAMTLPQNLGSGIWNPCKYYPYMFKSALCMEALDRPDEASEIYKQILNTRIEFFSKLHLRELPYYQALCANRLGLHIRARNIITAAKREWYKEFDKIDNGFFSATPFFISFTDDPAQMRRAYYLYLTALVELYSGDTDKAAKMFEESHHINSDHMFCGFMAQHINNSQA